MAVVESELVVRTENSIKTTGSISVERVAKLLRRTKLANKNRNRLNIDKHALLLRIELNLRLKKEPMQSVKAALGKVVDILVYE
jgi:hypothetical protein